MVEQKLLSGFLDELCETVPIFRWHLEGRRLRAVRAIKPRVFLPKGTANCYCPITAVYHLKTHCTVSPAEVFDVADQEMGLKLISLHLAEAADGKEGYIRKQMLRAVRLEK